MFAYYDQTTGIIETTICTSFSWNNFAIDVEVKWTTCQVLLAGDSQQRSSFKGRGKKQMLRKIEAEQ